LLTFDLEVSSMRPPWDAVSQGRRSQHEILADGSRLTRWELVHPTEEIYLVAGPWHEYTRQADEVEVFVFLRDDDPSLAQRYLDATARYLVLYEGMLPPYPYASFALVENFWETGYGMPGFTLLGPRVIRFPWILTSSYPHELLHPTSCSTTGGETRSTSTSRPGTGARV
jgi:aminopeptidase N